MRFSGLLAGWREAIWPADEQADIAAIAEPQLQHPGQGAGGKGFSAFIESNDASALGNAFQHRLAFAFNQLCDVACAATFRHRNFVKLQGAPARQTPGVGVVAVSLPGRTPRTGSDELNPQGADTLWVFGFEPESIFVQSFSIS